ncbi:MAG: hypothetical protein IK122_02650 [Alphaproteobacteria bacterium]|nr:hypothetical protein [Alphaproteobacteria bacterium]
MRITNLPITMAIIICVTVIILFIVACVHDTNIKKIDARSMAKFNKAFPDFKNNNANNAVSKEQFIKEWQASTVPDSNDLDFPEQSKQVETRPQSINRYH